MNKELLTNEIEKLINGDITEIEFSDVQLNTRKDKFLVNTAKRLIKANSLFRHSYLYKNDFLIALRDYLIFFDTTINVKNQELLIDNQFGITYDVIEGRYFAALQVPKGLNDKFVRTCFARGFSEELTDTQRDDLTTNSMIYNLTGYDNFKSLEQKLAVYGALNTPDGYTTLVSLPTGGGKSLITQTIAYQKDGLTIVVVPTVSLAIDQERVTKAAIKRRDINEEVFSYSSGVNAGPIIKAIKAKKARVLFISPEALLENHIFADAISQANNEYYLKNIVIDEAHIIVDWGASFRVDYQCLEAWRNKLLISNPTLRTLLLSATFEDRCIKILRNFFAQNEKWIEIRCDSLRHEPRYCVVREKNNNEKINSILDMVQKLPHPMIIYVARPIDADFFKNKLSEVGINNVKTYTGVTSGSQRKKLIDEWVNDEFEIMVATSAFGVGVNKSDVRTVIHTYIPQNANTYYQELGRGGRDGLPCLSVMCLNPEDNTIGKERIAKKVLTVEKIKGRWESLYNNFRSTRITENRVFIDTSIKPNYSEADEFDDSPTSDADMNWNIYVLLFLRRYNMIKIIDVTIDKGHYMILIQIIDDRLRNMNEDLEQHLMDIRNIEWNYYSDSYNAISNAVKSSYKGCISELFTDTYSKAYEYCAGCNSHDKIIIGDMPKFPLKNQISQPIKNISEEQALPFGTANELLVIMDETADNLLLKRLFGKGISVVIIPDNFKNQKEFLNISNDTNVMIFTVEEAFQIMRLKGYYFISGMIAVLYSKEKKELAEQFIVIKNNLCDKPGSKLIHIVYKNTFIPQAGKRINELVNGPYLNANVIFV